MDLLDETKHIFKKRFMREPALIVSAPGRVNLIGEHTDYNEGHVLPVAIDRFTAVAASSRADRLCRLYTANLDEGFEFDLDRLLDDRPHWVSYIMGVLAEMERDGWTISGKDIVVNGTVPVASGLSSSAALEIATATAVERLEGFQIDDARMVRFCQKSEHHFIGVQCGPMDQYASRACRRGHAGLLDCRSMEMTHHRLPEGIDLVSIYSGIPRSLAASAYNERLESCRKVVKILRKTDPHIHALRDATTDLVESHKSNLGERIYRRARHVVTEQERVFELIQAMEREDRRRMGEILMAGHESLSRDYEVSLPLLDNMVEWLCRQSGVIGARLTGAGFGGSLICLAESDACDVESLSEIFLEQFEKKTPERPQIWTLTTVDGARYQS